MATFQAICEETEVADISRTTWSLSCLSTNVIGSCTLSLGAITHSVTHYYDFVNEFYNNDDALILQDIETKETICNTLNGTWQ